MYQPRISDENIRSLYQLRILLGKPMTRVLNEILKEYFSLHPVQGDMELEKKRFKNYNFIAEPVANLGPDSHRDKLYEDSDSLKSILLKRNTNSTVATASL